MIDTKNSLYQEGAKAQAKYWRESLIVLPAVPMFYDQTEYEEMSRLSKTALEYHRVYNGDSNDFHDLDCARLLTSPAGQAPKAVNEFTIPLLNNLGNAKLLEYVRGVLGFDKDTELYFRRAQSHEMSPGQFIGPHVDQHADPDYDCVVILYLPSDYTGGNHVLDYQDGRPNRHFPTQAGLISIGPIDVKHWVTPVESGYRRSLVGFISRYNGENRRVISSATSY